MLYIWHPDQPLEVVSNSSFKNAVADRSAVVWLDLEGDPDSLSQELTGLDSLHPLTIERLFTPGPRAFLEEFDDYLHILLQEIHYHQTYQVCHFILGSNYLITIHRPNFYWPEKTNPPSRFFSQGSDILFYYLVQPIIEAGFEALDTVADITEELEDKIFSRPDNQLLNELFNLKRELIEIRKALAPMREVFALISRRDNPFVDDQALPFMSHHYDQLIRLHEISDSQREIVASALEIYLSSISNRMNEIMKTLTIVSTIILPATLVVGFYGMNFQHFPGLSWKYGIWCVLFLILIGTAGMLWYFKRKKWL